MIRSYPKIYGEGKSEIADLFQGPVVIQEKVDGSQFTFWLDDEGLPRFRSRGTEINPADTKSPFARSVASVLAVHELVGLDAMVVYRGEALSKLKHNELKYGRAPKGHVVLFDCQVAGAHETYTTPEWTAAEAVRLGLEPVPTLYAGPGEDFDQELLTTYMERTSVLGGCLIEGVVVKNYSRRDKGGDDGKALMGKFVRAEFKEKMKNRIKKGPVDVVAELGARYCTAARWRKAIQHLRDAGTLTGTKADIPLLYKEVNRDLIEEEETDIKEILYKSFRKQVLKGATNGLATWYMAVLAEVEEEEIEHDDGRTTEAVREGD